MNITLEEFKRLDIRIGEILNAEKVENADKLLKLEVDFGEFKRQIVAGIAKWHEPKDLVGKRLPFIINLEPRNFKGVESQGMLMAVDGEEKPVLLEPQGDVKAGDKIV
ncbi:MAG: methionine--tRNA ligase subunit beta [Candidatus Levybacteria bacterium RIFCSPLOWO2_01_FULL_38_13]|nr:MAG: methionine--tRNA ligase subunit beta [Candidatus Levybacteria bacterium RIFCSPHIGHO2_01_FULL_41_15]OGH35076.1 MAG: methionine--tRNA ligase subunit beta [Candidatus Levybacteria bacterium RIFCSPLOWO2_01_FULL_38_13]